MDPLNLIEIINRIEERVNAIQNIQSGQVLIDGKNGLRKRSQEDIGVRKMIYKIDFEKEFSLIPNVVVGFNELEMASDGSFSSFSLSAQKVKKSGFELVVKTWSNSEIYEINAFWIAFSGGS